MIYTFISFKETAYGQTYLACRLLLAFDTAGVAMASEETSAISKIQHTHRAGLITINYIYTVYK